MQVVERFEIRQINDRISQRLQQDHLLGYVRSNQRATLQLDGASPAESQTFRVNLQIVGLQLTTILQSDEQRPRIRTGCHSQRRIRQQCLNAVQLNGHRPLAETKVHAALRQSNELTLQPIAVVQPQLVCHAPGGGQLVSQTRLLERFGRWSHQYRPHLVPWPLQISPKRADEVQMLLGQVPQVGRSLQRQKAAVNQQQAGHQRHAVGAAPTDQIS